jgi:hypothetical protein
MDAHELNSTFDLLAVIGKDVELKKSGIYWIGACPICGGHDRLNIKITPHGYDWICRKCSGDKYHSSIDYFMKLHNVNFKEAVRLMGVDIPNLDPATRARHDAERAEQAARELEQQINKAQKVLEELRQAQSWLRYHEQLTAQARQTWEAWGIPEYWQDYWKLGFDPNHVIWTGEQEWYTPTMTIPLFAAETWEIQNVRHRLLNPPKPNDKYRPERSGLLPAFFVADPDSPIAQRTLLVEGEKKAMVSYIAADDAGLCVLGVPGKNVPDHLISKMDRCDPIYICLDPDAMDEARAIAGTLGNERCRIIELPGKIDDMILASSLDKNWMHYLLRQAKRA